MPVAKSQSPTFGQTALRVGGSALFYGQDTSAVQLPRGVGGPLGLGAVEGGALPSRPEAWSLRASLRQGFESRSWDATLASF